jgi:hypothetical protein
MHESVAPVAQPDRDGSHPKRPGPVRASGTRQKAAAKGGIVSRHASLPATLVASGAMIAGRDLCSAFTSSTPREALPPNGARGAPGTAAAVSENRP